MSKICKWIVGIMFVFLLGFCIYLKHEIGKSYLAGLENLNRFAMLQNEVNESQNKVNEAGVKFHAVIVEGMTRYIYR